MSIIDIAKRIAENPLVRHGEDGHWMSVYDPDAVAVARELMRLLDDTPADRDWAKSVGLADGRCNLYCDVFSEWSCDLKFYGKKTRGQVRCLAKVFGVELKEGE